MNRKIFNLANKYGRAFFNLYGAGFTDQSFWDIKDAAGFLNKNRMVLSYLECAKSGSEQKLITVFLQHFKLHKDFSRLLVLLRKQKRILLFPDILHCILSFYLEQGGKMYFDLQSYPKLSSVQEKPLVDFLSNATGHKILYRSVEKHRLIAGLRMQSDQLLWENSVRGRLRMIHRKLVRK